MVHLQQDFLMEFKVYVKTRMFTITGRATGAFLPCLWDGSVGKHFVSLSSLSLRPMARHESFLHKERLRERLRTLEG